MWSYNDELSCIRNVHSRPVASLYNPAELVSPTAAKDVQRATRLRTYYGLTMHLPAYCRSGVSPYLRSSSTGSNSHEYTGGRRVSLSGSSSGGLARGSRLSLDGPEEEELRGGRAAAAVGGVSGSAPGSTRRAGGPPAAVQEAQQRLERLLGPQQVGSRRRAVAKARLAVDAPCGCAYRRCGARTCRLNLLASVPCFLPSVMVA